MRRFASKRTWKTAFMLDIVGAIHWPNRTNIHRVVYWNPLKSWFITTHWKTQHMFLVQSFVLNGQWPNIESCSKSYVYSWHPIFCWYTKRATLWVFLSISILWDFHGNLDGPSKILMRTFSLERTFAFVSEIARATHWLNWANLRCVVYWNLLK